MNFTITQVHTAIFFGIISMVGAFLSWAVNIKIRHDILEHNEKTISAINEVKDGAAKDNSTAKDNAVKDDAVLREKLEAQITRLEHEFNQLKAELTDKIQTAISKELNLYVRTDLFDQSKTAYNDRLENFRQLIELYMGKIEQSLDRQIADLKDRLPD